MRRGTDLIPASEKVGMRICKNLGCNKAMDVLACLRTKSYNEISQATVMSMQNLKSGFSDLIFQPSIDGYVLPDDPAKLWRTGKSFNLPILIGNNTNEGTLFADLFFSNIDTINMYKNHLKALFKNNSAIMWDKYSANTPEEILPALSRLITEQWFIKSTLIIANTSIKKGLNVWLYLFNRNIPIKIFRIVYGDASQETINNLGIAHGIELPYVFGTFKKSDNTKIDREISNLMINYWTNFAKTGNPNSHGIPLWYRYNENKKPMLFNSTL